jgi:hypothetical protein
MSEPVSNERKEFAVSLAKVQAKLQGAKKDSDNPYFKSKYADLASVWDACRKPLTEEGFSVVQIPAVMESRKIKVTTILMHKGGHSIEGELIMPVEKETPQAYGSAITYARRYALAAMVGVAPDDDDDGNIASGNGHRQNGKGAGAPHPENKQPPQNKPNWEPHPDDVDALVSDHKRFGEVFKSLGWGWNNFVKNVNNDLGTAYEHTTKLSAFEPDHVAHMARIILAEKHAQSQEQVI